MKSMHSLQIKGMAVGVALVLLLEPIPCAMAQQASESPVPSSTNVVSRKAESAIVRLPDSPGAVHSALVAQQQPEQEPTSATSSGQQTSDQQAGTQQNSDAVNTVPTAGSESSGQTPSTLDAAEPSASNPVASQAPQRPHEPVGTAAAESVPVTGVAASRPAGSAVAPAKQRRVRSILIKVGAVVGVGVAVGTTMALSQGSPSRPPGSR